MTILPLQLPVCWAAPRGDPVRRNLGPRRLCARQVPGLRHTQLLPHIPGTPHNRESNRAPQSLILPFTIEPP